MWSKYYIWLSLFGDATACIAHNFHLVPKLGGGGGWLACVQFRFFWQSHCCSLFRIWSHSWFQVTLQSYFNTTLIVPCLPVLGSLWKMRSYLPVTSLFDLLSAYCLLLQCFYGRGLFSVDVLFSMGSQGARVRVYDCIGVYQIFPGTC
jgi:hypothetical protein